MGNLARTSLQFAMNAIQPRDPDEPFGTIVLDPADLISALEYNHLWDNDDTRSLLVSFEGTYRAEPRLVDLHPFDPLPEGYAQTTFLLDGPELVHDSLNNAVPPTRQEILDELDGRYSSEYQVDELHARCISGWRNNIRNRIVDTVLLNVHTGKTAGVEIAAQDP